MKIPGFSIIEFLLYIGIVTLIIGCTTTALMYTYSSVVRAHHSLHEMSMLSTACDVFAHDVYEASDARDTWYQPDVHTILFRCGTTDMCWLVKEKKLMRVTGTYDRNSQRWTQRTISVMSTGVTAWACTLIPSLHASDTICAVTCEIAGDDSSVTRYVALRVGRVV
ncbi:MAG: hypothetical protein ACHQVS_02405 [Candidatus Babeliales bacterium]